jgi:Arc/MetJ-type ribon-helix-helix transcriptional regulator
MPIAKIKPTVSLHLPSDIQEQVQRICRQQDWSASDLLRKALNLYLSLYELEVFSVTVDSEKAIDLLSQEKTSLAEIVDKFEALRRAVEIIMEAVQAKK